MIGETGGRGRGRGNAPERLGSVSDPWTAPAHRLDRDETRPTPFDRLKSDFCGLNGLKTAKNRQNRPQNTESRRCADHGTAGSVLARNVGRAVGNKVTR